MILRRRMLATALTTPLLAAAAATAKSSQKSDREIDIIDLYKYGAIGDGIADDTLAVQKAFDAASSGNLLRIPQGKFRITAPVALKGLINIIGYGAETSEVILDKAATFQYVGKSANDYDSDQITIRNVGFRCAKSRPRSAGAVFDISFSGGKGGTIRSAIVEDVEVSGAEEGSGFDCALRFVNARNLKINGARIRGDRNARGNSIGIDLLGDESPVDIFLSNISCYFLNKAINIGGTVEGVYLSQSVFVAIDYGVYARPPHTNPLLFVQNCHVNAFRSCIDINNIVQFDISHNLLYAAKPLKPLPPKEAKLGFVAISIGMHENVGVTSRISGNTIIGTMPIDIPKNGIYVDGEKSEFSLSIDGNEFVGWDTAVILGTGANGVLVSASNRFRSNKDRFLDLSGRNIFSSSRADTEGYSLDDNGVETKWGTNVVTLDAQGVGKVLLPKPFKNKLQFCIGSSGDPSIAGSAHFAIDQMKSSAAELLFTVTPNPGPIVVRLNWIAIGS